MSLSAFGTALLLAQMPVTQAASVTAPAMTTQAVEVSPVIEGATSWVVVEVRTPAPTTAATERQQVLDQRQRALDERQAALDARQQALDERAALLEQREADLAVQATQLADPLTVRDMFTRDDDLAERVGPGPDGFQPGVDGEAFTPGVDGGFSPGPAETVIPFFTTRDPPEAP